MKKIILIFFLQFVFHIIYSQDSLLLNDLRVKLNNTENDSEKVEILLNFSDLYTNISTDSSLKYAKQALNLTEQINSKKLVSKSYHNIGVVYYYKGDYNEALKYMFKALKISEEMNDKEECGAICNNIGNIYLLQENYDGALEFYLRDLNISKEIGNEKGAAQTIANIGLIYDDLGEEDKALEYYLSGMNLSEKLGDTVSVTNANINIGVVYQAKDNHEQAIKYFQKALDLAKKTNNNDASALAYINCGLSYSHLNEFDKSEENLFKAVEVCKTLGSKNYLSYTYKYLSNIYYKKMNYKSALEYYSLSVKYKDSIFNEEKSKQFAEMQTRFETEKKQKQIEIQNLKLNQKDLELNKKQFIIYAFIGGLLLMILLVVIVYNSYRQKKKSNEIILSQNKSLEQANEEITAQRDEIEAQRDTLDEKNKLLEYQNIKITDSITYAKYIQQAVLPSNDQLKNLLKGYFIVFRPKDIVSGDFYWAAKINDTLIITVADCTGHGVPGAIMSMLGISFLNEIVRRQEVRQANHVLNLLRISIIEALNQTGELDEQKDGMDISLIAINTTPQAQTSEGLEPSEVLRAYSAQWAGANNPLWVIRNPKFQDSNSKTQENPDTTWNLEFETCFLELKGDKMPIAIYDRMDDFTNHELQLFTDDMIYLLSDGYEDQSGGTKGKKFLAKNLKQLLIDNCRLSMNEQKEILEKTLVNWIGDGEQIDDITILGLQI